MGNAIVYALVQDNSMVQQGSLPIVWYDGERDWDLRPMSDVELAELGWYLITIVNRPPNTDTTTFDYSVELVDGLPTEVWTERPWTVEELSNQEKSQNTSEIITDSSEAVDKLVVVVNNLKCYNIYD